MSDYFRLNRLENLTIVFALLVEQVEYFEFSEIQSLNLNYSSRMRPLEMLKLWPIIKFQWTSLNEDIVQILYTR